MPPVTEVKWDGGKYLAWCGVCQDGQRSRHRGKALVWAIHHDTVNHGHSTKEGEY